MLETSQAVAAARDAVLRRCPGVPADAVEDFLSRMDADYFARVSPEDVAAHVEMASRLAPGSPARLRVRPADAGAFEVTVVAYDFFAEFALLCGLLTAHGLEIESGHVHTYAPAATPRPVPRRSGRRPPPLSSRKIVDVFRVRPRGRGTPAPDEPALQERLVELLTLVIEGRAAEARERLNRLLVESLERLPGPPPEALTPVSIEFEDEPGSPWTALRVRGRDTPGFLYAFANALSMRGVYVQAVTIGGEGGEARDRFLIARRDGGRIDDEQEQAALRLTVALIKQFTHFLPWAPDPALALHGFDQLLDRLVAEGAEAVAVFSSPAGLAELARLLGSSAFLWEDFLRVQFEHLLPVLGAWRERPLRSRSELRADLRERLAPVRGGEEEKAVLNGFKDEEMLLIDMKRLLDPGVDLSAFQAALTGLGDTVVEEAIDLAAARVSRAGASPWGGRRRFAAFALGKFGGAELGWASDLELIFAYGEDGEARVEDAYDRLVRELLDLVVAREDGIFHIDLRLRPYGNKGPLASPLSALRDYYRPGGGAAPFERQALVKLRPVTGDPGLIRDVMAVRDAFVWSEEPWDREDALHLRDRQARELVPPGRVSVKYSRGTLVETEYAVQYLQILHGGTRPALRSPSTLAALEALRSASILEPAEAEALCAAYLFWRRVADGLRMLRGQAKDLLLPPEGSEEMGRLARRLGYAGAGWKEPAEALEAEARRHREAVARLFDRRFR